MPPADALVVALAQWLAAATATWIGAGVLLAAMTRARGPVARAGRLALQAYPPLVRRWALAVAAGAASAVTLPTPALADAPRPPRPVVIGALDWPTVSPAPVPERPRRPARVVVRQGDSLWTLAARDLGSHPTDAAVAAAWPRWWAANRTVIGPDPDLLQPGTRLQRPHHTERTPR